MSSSEWPPASEIANRASVGEDAYVREGWTHRDERYRSLPVFMARGVACEFDLMTPAAMARSPFYQELLRPGASMVPRGEGRRRRGCVGSSLQRRAGQGPFSPQELEPLAALSRRL